MPDRKISAEEWNALFGSPQFIRKLEQEAPKLAAHVFRDATEEEFAMWLKEGYALQQDRPRFDKTGAKKKWWHFWK